MGDEEKKTLTREEKIEALRTMIASRGWQEVLKPALQGAINATTAQWMGSLRMKGEEHLTDEALKQRAASLSWVLAWERKYKELVQEFERMEKMREQTETADGGSPY